MPRALQLDEQRIPLVRWLEKLAKFRFWPFKDKIKAKNRKKNPNHSRTTKQTLSSTRHLSCQQAVIPTSIGSTLDESPQCTDQKKSSGGEDSHVNDSNNSDASKHNHQCAHKQTPAHCAAGTFLLDQGHHVGVSRPITRVIVAAAEHVPGVCWPRQWWWG